MTDTKIQNKFTIKKVGNIQALHINGQLANCAYRMPVMLPHPTLQGQIQIHSPICGDCCQFFNIRKTSDYTGITNPIKVLTTECNKTTFNVYFDESEPEAPKSNLMRL